MKRHSGIAAFALLLVTAADGPKSGDVFDPRR